MNAHFAPTSREKCKTTWCEVWVSCKVDEAGTLPVPFIITHPHLEQSLALWSLNKHMLNE